MPVFLERKPNDTSANPDDSCPIFMDKSIEFFQFHYDGGDPTFLVGGFNPFEKILVKLDHIKSIWNHHLDSYVNLR